MSRELLTSDDDDVVCGFLSLFLACDSRGVKGGTRGCSIVRERFRHSNIVRHRYCSKIEPWARQVLSNGGPEIFEKMLGGGASETERSFLGVLLAHAPVVIVAVDRNGVVMLAEGAAWPRSCVLPAR